MPRFNSPVRITVVSYRYRLADPDGISSKAAIDGLVKAGILTNDTSKQVQEVRSKQVKIRRTTEEKTEIILEDEDK